MSLLADVTVKEVISYTTYNISQDFVQEEES